MYQPPPGWVPYGPPPKKSLAARIGGGGFVVIFAMLFGTCAVVRGAAHAGQSSSPSTASTVAAARMPAAEPPSAAASAPAIKVTSNQLFDAYHANEVTADDKYKGERLLVTGAVDSIDKGAFGGMHLRLATSNQFMSTMCDMEDSEKSGMAHLSKGQRVTVLCTGQGMIIGTPSLTDCTLQ